MNCHKEAIFMFKHALKVLSLLSTLCLSFSLWAGTLTVSDAYVRASLPGTKITSAYMVIANPNQEVISLTQVTSPISERVEIHEHAMVDGMMKMRELDAIAIQAQSSVILQPGGLHLMIFDLNSPLKPEQSIELTLHFSDKTEQTIQVPVQAIKPKTHHHHHQHK